MGGVRPHNLIDATDAHEVFESENAVVQQQQQQLVIAKTTSAFQKVTGILKTSKPKTQKRPLHKSPEMMIG